MAQRGSGWHSVTWCGVVWCGVVNPKYKGLSSATYHYIDIIKWSTTVKMGHGIAAQLSWCHESNYVCPGPANACGAAPRWPRRPPPRILPRSLSTCLPLQSKPSPLYPASHHPSSLVTPAESPAVPGKPHAVPCHMMPRSLRWPDRSRHHHTAAPSTQKASPMKEPWPRQQPWHVAAAAGGAGSLGASCR